VCNDAESFYDVIESYKANIEGIPYINTMCFTCYKKMKQTCSLAQRWANEYIILTPEGKCQYIPNYEYLLESLKIVPEGTKVGIITQKYSDIQDVLVPGFQFNFYKRSDKELYEILDDLDTYYTGSGSPVYNIITQTGNDYEESILCQKDSISSTLRRLQDIIITLNSGPHKVYKSKSIIWCESLEVLNKNCFDKTLVAPDRYNDLIWKPSKEFVDYVIATYNENSDYYTAQVLLLGTMYLSL
jgi:hypothetical protein